MKGLYPTTAYVLLFTLGIIIFFLIYQFTGDFINHKRIELENIQTEKICNFLKNLENKTGVVEIDIGNYRIENHSLRIIGSYSHECNLTTKVKGFCSSLCKIKFSKELFILSDI